MTRTANTMLAVLLIAALLLCHGAFGVWHQFSGHASETTVASFVDHGAAHGAAGGTQGAAECHAVAAANYEAAPMLLLLLGATLLLLLSGDRLWRWSPAPRFPVRRPPAILLPPPAASGAAVLQVFRL